MVVCMTRFACTMLLPFVVGALVFHAKTQSCGSNAQSPITTDRPQVTDWSIVVQSGSLQLRQVAHTQAICVLWRLCLL
jgi:hypothetical protein